ncbi:MAG: response regulator [Desulfobacteraceae bacterium]|nr:MAG: response regulator [Desulfobacteraceae bacterium]
MRYILKDRNLIILFIASFLFFLNETMLLPVLPLVLFTFGYSNTEPILDMTRTMLEGLGYKVSDFINSQEALATFNDDPYKFDLVITDMTMPHMTGLEMIKKMYSVRPEMPVILCTGFSAVINQEKAFALGIKGFLTKPILKKEMAKTIREVLDT